MFMHRLMYMYTLQSLTNTKVALTQQREKAYRQESMRDKRNLGKERERAKVRHMCTYIHMRRREGKREEWASRDARNTKMRTEKCST